jgi:predicted helicase
VARKIKENVEAAEDHGLLPQYMRQRFVANTYGFEFLAAPYTIAHLKLARFLKDECGLTLQPEERLKIYLTNTLRTEEVIAPALPFLEQLSAETRAAASVKTEQPILVVIGNPPWSGNSENLNISLEGADIVEPFKWSDGSKVDHSKWLNNDYVKFIRWAQWRITQSALGSARLDAGIPSCGVVVLITDNSYLASPTFRGMRRFLLTEFDDIYIVNLLGNTRSGNGGAKDENIFEIQQGVCIGIFVRRDGGGTRETPAAISVAGSPAPGRFQGPFVCLDLPPKPGRGRGLRVRQWWPKAPGPSGAGSAICAAARATECKNTSGLIPSLGMQFGMPRLLRAKPHFTSTSPLNRTPCTGVVHR